MAVYNAWVVEYKNGSTWTAIDNVQELSCQVGRQTAVDQWPVSQASMRIWYPNGYTTPLANLTIGTYIRFFAPGRSSTKPSWTGLVKNVTVEVGIPWNSGTLTGNGDFLVIDCEGAYALAGRTNSAYLTFAGFPWRADRVVGAIGTTVGNAFGLPAYWDTSTTWYTQYTWFTSPDPPNQWTENASNMIAQLIALYQTRLADGIRVTWSYTYSAGSTDDPGIFFNRPAFDNPTVTTVGFSDTTNNSTNREYDTITFDGLADQYFTQAVLTTADVDPAYGPVIRTLTSSVGSSPFRTYTNELPPNYSTNFPQSVADYYANVFNPADIGISSISATTAGQHTQNLDTFGVTDLELGYLPFYVVPVTLRGTTYYCQIEGVAITADTNQTRFTYYVTPTDTTAWFTLDSSTFGVLDQNRLGIY